MKKVVLQILDANYNRGKEGLRVVEDILRYCLKDESLRKKTKTLRHRLDKIHSSIIKLAILSRQSSKDIGKETDALETKRKNVSDILYSNLQRAKESLRVLEEFLKLNYKSYVPYIKKLRYKTYELEKDIVKKWPDLYNS